MYHPSVFPKFPVLPFKSLEKLARAGLAVSVEPGLRIRMDPAFRSKGRSRIRIRFKPELSYTKSLQNRTFV